MERVSRGIRGIALQKIASLTATVPESRSTQSDLDRLCNAYHGSKSPASRPLNGGYNPLSAASRASMSLREVEFLFAICKAAPLITTVSTAEKLLLQLSPYLVEAHSDAITSASFLEDIEPSPWEAMSYYLAHAALAIGTKHASLSGTVLNQIWKFLDQIVSSTSTVQRLDTRVEASSDEDEAMHIAAITASLLGFLTAAAAHAPFWSGSARLHLTKTLRSIISESFLVCVESTFSTIRNSHSSKLALHNWKRYSRHYAAAGRPLGAMLLKQAFLQLVGSCITLVVADAEMLRKTDALNILVSQEHGFKGGIDADDSALVEVVTEIATEQMRVLEDGSDYLELGSVWQQRLAFSAKACALKNFLICMVIDEDIADADTLMMWLENTMADIVQMADEHLASVVLRSLPIVARLVPAVALSSSRSLPRFIVQGAPRGQTALAAARALAHILRLLSQDAIITTLYSLGNVLSSGPTADRAINGTASPDGSIGKHRNGVTDLKQLSGSAISLLLSNDEENLLVYGNVVQAIVEIARNSKDDKIIALAQSMLIQKFGRINDNLDARIIAEAAVLATYGGPLEFRSLLKLFSKLGHEAIEKGNSLLINAISKARLHLSTTTAIDSPLFRVYLIYTLEAIIGIGDVHECEYTHQDEVELGAEEIGHLLQPVAILMSTHRSQSLDSEKDGDVDALLREAWFNVVVHGITLTSKLGQHYENELRTLAMCSKSLIVNDRADQLESDVELNTVLRRGMNGQHTAEQKRRFISLVPGRESEIRSLSYPKIVFLSAAYLVESLRANSGDCTKVLTYFLDPSLKGSDMGQCLVAIADDIVSIYLRKVLSGNQHEFAAPFVAQQLLALFRGCCHRIVEVQQIAASCADRIITQIPSSLCQKTSLFGLLELLDIMWSSCLDAEIDEYAWRSTFTSAKGKVSVELPDDYGFRRTTLNALYKRAKNWIMRVMDIAPLDVKGLLQTYLSEYDDDGAYGHVSLGRSFALEIGSLVPRTDQKLSAIDHHGNFKINTASDFVAQYTTRQEYRHADTLPECDEDWLKSIQVDGHGVSPVPKVTQAAENAEAVLAHLEDRIARRKSIPVWNLRDVLRRAAALLCRTKKDRCAITHHLVGIPFTIFSKQSIKLGISLWLGVINENPRMEPRILMEIAENWEKTVRNRLGIFSDNFRHLDPFYIKQEFSPSEKEIILRQQQAAHNLIAPHLRILKFLTSHFNATRLGNSQTLRIFHRLIKITLNRIRHSTGHPLAREVNFQFILFSLNILKSSVSLTSSEQWRLKDQILSAALSWFSKTPRWSFGGNRLQIKAEVRIMTDMDVALRTVADIGSNSAGSLHSLQSKQDLLLMLLENEHNRLVVWLFPSDQERKHRFFSGHSSRTNFDIETSALVKTAWTESPGLAVQLVARFPSSKLANDARWRLINFPEKATDEPDALQILLGPLLPDDISVQLKYLLYWAPVNPITAVTYFLPAYGNHPFVVQYAMRALESHSVDVTFFYVPQIVQALRYDVLGYIQRYIIEAAKFSQLFAHQIIWNMKANAYKDEDSQVPDPVKRTLDKVMAHLISSFSDTDKEFYEREFSFFNEITDISGKLRPYIKKSKPEKKQKIEEELRKIEVEIGVYLPSNPDGIVIGIDRKSGKPLQSHAKAPYMATFRIRKNRGDMEATDRMLEKTNQSKELDREYPASHEDTHEVWQSAIFKVGDDCRQDVLALQMIAAFRGIFNNVGLDVYVYPYRVTATAPGCGVIDVLPNSISRDMLGREAVNGLYDYFVSKYGGEDSIRFQEARNNFVKSMAAYSVISYLLQFKDRHNGNIMVDDAGHILHIDFGFCFDIAPGGVRFERAPFKLTSEMVAVMGGSTESQSYRWFEELCIKAFLASRQYTEKLIHLVILMMDSGLPCFKPETIQHFRERFVLQRSEREAADFMKDLIKKSYHSFSTKGYDQFQLMTNGIPY